MQKTTFKTIAMNTLEKTSLNIGIKHINKKGTFKKREKCNSCQFHGYVPYGLYGNYKNDTCDRDIITWRECKGKTIKTCNYFTLSSFESLYPVNMKE